MADISGPQAKAELPSERLVDSEQSEGLVDSEQSERLVDSEQSERQVDSEQSEGKVDSEQNERLVDSEQSKRQVDSKQNERLILNQTLQNKERTFIDDEMKISAAMKWVCLQSFELRGQLQIIVHTASQRNTAL